MTHKIKRPKIIFFDIDGTLVSFRTHRIPQSTLDAVHRIREKGTKVWIATGRPVPFINNLGELEYDGIMCVNGGHCVKADGTVIFSRPVGQSDVIRMIEEQKKTGMAVVYAGNENAILTAPDGVPDSVHEVFSLLNLPLPQLRPCEQALDMEVMQVIAFFSEKQSQHIMKNVLKECNETRWHPAFADCVAAGTDKATGIDAVIAHHGFDISETMAFGDGGNDITMLRHSGTGVAMGNANDNVKASADIITSSVDEDGIANILNALT